MSHFGNFKIQIVPNCPCPIVPFLYYIIIGVTLLLLSCGNSNSGKNDELIDGGHGIGIDTTTVNEIKYYEDSIRTKESAKESTTSVAPSSSREEYHKHDNMRGFDPASEDDMDDNGMTRYMEANDEEAWN